MVASAVVVDTGSVVVVTTVVVVVVIVGIVVVVAGGGLVVDPDRGDVVDAPGTGAVDATVTEPTVVGGSGIMIQGPSTLTMLPDTIVVVDAVGGAMSPWRPVVVVASPASRSP